MFSWLKSLLLLEVEGGLLMIQPVMLYSSAANGGLICKDRSGKVVASLFVIGEKFELRNISMDKEWVSVKGDVVLIICWLSDL